MNISNRILDNYKLNIDNNNEIYYNKYFIESLKYNNDVNLFKFLSNNHKNIYSKNYNNNDNNDIESLVLAFNYLLFKNDIISNITIENINETINDNLKLLDLIFDININFNNFEYENICLMTNRGNLTVEKIYSLINLYYLQKSLGGSLKKKKIVEIGGDNGYTAYFAYMLGVSEYIIIDEEINNIIKFWNLSHYIGENNVSFFLEKKDTIVKLYNNVHYEKLYFKNYDLIFNSYGLIKFGLKIAYNYFENFNKVSKFFLSINHEENKLIENKDLPFTFKNFFEKDIDYKIYINKYDDLKIALKNKNDSLYHYEKYGKFEGRTPNLLKDYNEYRLIFNDYLNKNDKYNKWRNDDCYLVHLIEYKPFFNVNENLILSYSIHINSYHDFDIIKYSLSIISKKCYLIGITYSFDNNLDNKIINEKIDELKKNIYNIYFCDCIKNYGRDFYKYLHSMRKIFISNKFNENSYMLIINDGVIPINIDLYNNTLSKLEFLINEEYEFIGLLSSNEKEKHYQSWFWCCNYEITNWIINSIEKFNFDNNNLNNIIDNLEIKLSNFLIKNRKSISLYDFNVTNNIFYHHENVFIEALKNGFPFLKRNYFSNKFRKQGNINFSKEILNYLPKEISKYIYFDNN